MNTEICTSISFSFKVTSCNVLSSKHYFNITYIVLNVCGAHGIKSLDNPHTLLCVFVGTTFS